MALIFSSRTTELPRANTTSLLQSFVHETTEPVQAISSPSSQKVLTTYSQLPLVFEPNQGQTDARVKFLARGSGYGLYLTAHEAVLALQQPKSRTSVVNMKL